MANRSIRLNEKISGTLQLSKGKVVAGCVVRNGEIVQAAPVLRRIFKGIVGTQIQDFEIFAKESGWQAHFQPVTKTL